MARLLNLPTEILDSIIEFVILDESPAPANVEEARGTRLPRKESTGYRKFHLLYDNAAGRSNSVSLLRANLKLRQQTEQAISRIYPTGAVYKLDVMLVDEEQLWPTWRHVPYLTEHVETVEVTFRTFGKRVVGRNKFASGDNGPPPIVWPLYDLLKNFCHYGPYPRTEETRLEAKSRRDVTVQSINMWFETGDDTLPLPSDNLASRRDWFRSRGSSEISPYAIHPNWFAMTVATELTYLCNMKYHTSFYGMVLHRHLGRVRVLQPHLPEMDVGSILGRLSVDFGSLYTTSTMGHMVGTCRVISFWNWKWDVTQLRRARGLPVSEDSTWLTQSQWLELRELERVHSRQEEKLPWQTCNERCFCANTGFDDWLSEQPSE